MDDDEELHMHPFDKKLRSSAKRRQGSGASMVHWHSINESLIASYIELMELEGDTTVEIKKIRNR